jgi:hypothetical protein
MFAAPVVTAPTVRWALSPDGKRFLFAAPPNTGRVPIYGGPQLGRRFEKVGLRK